MLTDNETIELAELLRKATNGNERAFEDSLFAAITTLHPTLQQAYWRVTKNVINRYGDLAPSYFDARNKASREWARRVSGDDEGRPNFVGLPTI